jgi:hypothetical protein
MAYDPRKKVTKIFGQINKIAKKGKDYTLDYHKLIDEIVAKGDYAHLEMCLSDKYNLDPTKYRNIYEIKTKTWKHILFETEANFLTGLKKLYTSNGVYQQGYEIRSENNDFTLLRVSGGIEHYPFKEEKVVISDKWNNKVVRSKYTQVATAPQISIAKSATQSIIQIELFDPMVYQIEVSKVIWATYSVGTTQSSIIESPYELNRINNISTVGTQSYIPLVGTQSPPAITFYDSNIPMTHGGDYLVTVRRRGTPGWLSSDLTQESYSYKVYVRKENLLGTIKEFDYYDPGSAYLHMNARFAQITGLKRTFLEVMKKGAIEPITVLYDNNTVSEERNLLERYKIAIGYLNS